jgi:hypothetical protein
MRAVVSLERCLACEADGSQGEGWRQTDRQTALFGVKEARVAT